MMVEPSTSNASSGQGTLTAKSNKKSAAGENGSAPPTPPSAKRSQSLFGVVASLQQVHYVVRERERRLKSEWDETKPLLEQKKWAMVQQQKICTRELDNLVKGKNSKVEKHRAIRARRCNEVAAVYRPLLEKFYGEHNPEKVASIPNILMWYRGREHLMINKLEETYGASLDMTVLMNAGVLPDDSGEPRKDPIMQVLDAEGDKMWEDVLHLEQIFHRTSSLIEEVKQELYFPRAHGWIYRFGIDGVYGAIKDFWIEQLSGRVIVQVPDTARAATKSSPSPSQGFPPPGSSSQRQLEIRVCGAGAEHAVVSFRCDSFGIRGEKGTKVPSLSADLLSMRVEFMMTIPLVYKADAKKWIVNRKGFKFKIASMDRVIKGSFYPVPKSLLRMVLSHVLPGVIRRAVAENFPRELGGYLGRSMLPGRPLTFDLELLLEGIGSDVLDASINGDADSSRKAREMLGISKVQADAFVGLQTQLSRILDELGVVSVTPIVSSKDEKKKRKKQDEWLWPHESPLSTVAGFAMFYRRYCRPGKEQKQDWENILDFLQLAVNTNVKHANEAASVELRTVFKRVDEICRKPVKSCVYLRNLQLHTGLLSFASMLRDIFVRSAREQHDPSLRKSTRGPTKALDAQMKDIGTWHEATRVLLAAIHKNFERTFFTIGGSVSAGNLEVTVRDLIFRSKVLASLPISPNTHSPGELTYVTSVSPEGHFTVQVVKDGPEGTERTHFATAALQGAHVDIIRESSSGLKRSAYVMQLLREWQELQKAIASNNKEISRARSRTESGDTMSGDESDEEAEDTENTASAPKSSLSDETEAFAAYCCAHMDKLRDEPEALRLSFSQLSSRTSIQNPFAVMVDSRNSKVQARVDFASVHGALRVIVDELLNHFQDAEKNAPTLSSAPLQKYAKYLVSNSLLARFLLSVEAFSVKPTKVLRRSFSQSSSDKTPPPPPPPTGRDNDLYLSFVVVPGDRSPTLSVENEFSMLDVVADFLSPPTNSK